MASTFLEKLASSLLIRGAKKLLKDLGKKDEPIAPQPKQKDSIPTKAKVHPWRLCPIGEHWRHTHPLTVSVSEKNPDGTTTRHGHCVNNPKRKNKQVAKDYLRPEEIHAIADTHFSSLTGPPHAGKLPKFPDSDLYDSLIRGWTKYWNEIFQPSEPLDPDLIKALIASESNFELKPKPPYAGVGGYAHGLIQLTDGTMKILGDTKGELSDHFIEMDKKDASDPNVAICAGVRWFFWKKTLASNDLKRQATWREAVAEYKGYLADMISGKDPKPTGMQQFDEYYKDLKK